MMLSGDYDVDTKMTVDWRTTKYLEKSLVTHSRFKANVLSAAGEQTVRRPLERLYFRFCF